MDPVTGASPETALKKVDLPAPFAPMRPTTSPLRTSSETRVEGRDAAVLNGDVPGLEERAHRHLERQAAGHRAQRGRLLGPRVGRRVGLRAGRGPLGFAATEEPVHQSPQARYTPPIPSGWATTATTSNAADAIGTMRTASSSIPVNGIVDVAHELRQPLHHHRGGEDARGRAGPADHHDGDELQRLEQHEGVLGADRPLLDREQAARPSPTIAPDSAYASSLVGPGSMPKHWARASTSRTARNERPAQVTASRRRTTSTTATHASAKR